MPSAHADLDEYADRIREESAKAARSWLTGAWKKIFPLSENPRRFAIIDEAEVIGAEVRDVVHFSHRIIYRVKESERVVEILRVYHGARRPLASEDFE